jgi:excisionase family DNA binding protein
VEDEVEIPKNEFVFVKPVRAAKLLDISKSKIYEMIQRNEIPAVRLGGCLRIPVSAIDDLVAKAIGDRL